jgi:hypothetical protein
MKLRSSTHKLVRQLVSTNARMGFASLLLVICALFIMIARKADACINPLNDAKMSSPNSFYLDCDCAACYCSCHACSPAIVCIVTHCTTESLGCGGTGDAAGRCDYQSNVNSYQCTC